MLIRYDSILSTTGQRVEVPVGPGATYLTADDLFALPCVGDRIHAGVRATTEQIRALHALHADAALADRGEMDGRFVDFTEGS
jgi:hypothetical protein